MSIVKGTIIALAAATTIALAGPAFAQGEGSGNFVWMSGSDTQQMRFTADGLKAFMAQKPHELPKGTFIVRSGGKLYMLEDPKGTSYQMFRDMMLHGG